VDKIEYYKMLESMDWYYHYSDDMRVWRAGEAKQSELKRLASLDPILADMYSDYVDYVYNNKPKPKVEDYEKRVG
jgi:hypothetical protein